MPLPVIRYQLDPTGINLDNRVVGEIHNLTSRDIRAVAPIYGAYFTDSLKVYDNSTDRLLARGTDYQCVELLQEASLKYGKEICLLILILNKTVSNQVRINYQVLGGGFQNSAATIGNIYENVIKDNRPVDWVNVLNKPLTYNPSLHKHLIDDVVGFESLIHSIERVRNAIILSDVPAYESIIDYIHAHKYDYTNPHHTTKDQVGLGNVENLEVLDLEEIYLDPPVRKYITYDVLVNILDLRDSVRDFRLTPSHININEGKTVTFVLKTLGIPDGTKFIWNVMHLSTQDSDFTTTGGIVTVIEDTGYFSVTIVTDNFVEDTELFRVRLYENTAQQIMISYSPAIRVFEAPKNNFTYPPYVFTECCIFNPNIEINPATLFVANLT